MRREIEADLGPVIGTIMPAMTPIRRVRYQHPRWLENGTAMILAIIACSVASLFVALAVWMSFTLSAKPVLAHGPAEWIQRGNYKNAAGELCCGERDCFELADSDVKITARGYYIVSIKETVPFSEAAPSPTGTYWRCQWGGQRKCFFAPPSQT